MTTTQTQARRYWGTPYLFEPHAGGLGLQLVAGPASTRGVIPGTEPGLDETLVTLAIWNKGGPNQNVWVHVALGDATVVATENYMAIQPGGGIEISIPLGQAPPVYMAVIADADATDTAKVQVTAGFGV